MTRTQLPNRRPNVNFAFDWHGVAFVGAVGFDRLRRPMEIWMSCSKTTTELEAVGRDAAILVSLLLQHGVSFADMRKSVSRGEHGEAASLVGGLLDAVEGVTADEVRGLLR